MIHVAVLLHGTPVRIQNKGNTVEYVWLDYLNGLAQDSILVIFFEIDGIKTSTCKFSEELYLLLMVVPGWSPSMFLIR